MVGIVGPGDSAQKPQGNQHIKETGTSGHGALSNGRKVIAIKAKKNLKTLTSQRSKTTPLHKKKIAAVQSEQNSHVNTVKKLLNQNASKSELTKAIKENFTSSTELLNLINSLNLPELEACRDAIKDAMKFNEVEFHYQSMAKNQKNTKDQYRDYCQQHLFAEQFGELQLVREILNPAAVKLSNDSYSLAVLARCFDGLTPADMTLPASAYSEIAERKREATPPEKLGKKTIAVHPEDLPPSKQKGMTAVHNLVGDITTALEAKLRGDLGQLDHEMIISEVAHMRGRELVNTLTKNVTHNNDLEKAFKELDKQYMSRFGDASTGQISAEKVESEIRQLVENDALWLAREMASQNDGDEDFEFAILQELIVATLNQFMTALTDRIKLLTNDLSIGEEYILGETQDILRTLDIAANTVRESKKHEPTLQKGKNGSITVRQPPNS